MSLFDVMGPIMIGPSSSHTAGAARIGLFARLIYNRDFKSVRVILYNSFADTGIGHGTDKAIIGGLLGMKMDDPGLGNSFDSAKKASLEYSFEFREDIDKHPNYVQIIFPGIERDFEVGGISLGGGRIKISELNGMEVDFGGRHDLLILEYRDIPGMIGFIGETLGDAKVNIAYVQI
jgi:L-serine dehydratase